SCAEQADQQQHSSSRHGGLQRGLFSFPSKSFGRRNGRTFWGIVTSRIQTPIRTRGKPSAESDPWTEAAGYCSVLSWSPPSVAAPGPSLPHPCKHAGPTSSLF